jgi:hypothetical protein
MNIYRRRKIIESDKIFELKVEGLKKFEFKLYPNEVEINRVTKQSELNILVI